MLSRRGHWPSWLKSSDIPVSVFQFQFSVFIMHFVYDITKLCNARTYQKLVEAISAYKYIPDKMVTNIKLHIHIEIINWF